MCFTIALLEQQQCFRLRLAAEHHAVNIEPVLMVELQVKNDVNS